MSKKTTTTKRTTKTTRTYYTYTAPYWLLQLAFWLVVVIGAVMLVSGVLHKVGIDWFDRAFGYIMSACMGIAMIIPVVLSYRIARHKGTAWFIMWIIFVVLIVTGIVLTAL